MDFDQSRRHGWSGPEDSRQHRNDPHNAPSHSQPRVRWSDSLHQRFVNVISSLGGVDIAKPKAIIERMHVDGLTTDHVKSHLQKYRKDLRLGRQLAPIPPLTEARSVHFGVSTSTNGEASNMNRNNPTPPFPNEAVTSILTGETSNKSSFQSTCSSLQVGAGTTSQYRESTNPNGNTGTTPFFYSGAGALSWNGETSTMNKLKATSSLHLRPCASPGGETSHMKKMKVGSLPLGAGTSAPNVETFDIGRINTTSPLHLGSRASMLNGEIPDMNEIKATSSPPHLITVTSTGNVLPSNIIRQRNFNEAEATLRAQLEEQRRLQLTFSQMEAQRQNPLLAFQYLTRPQCEQSQSLQAQHSLRCYTPAKSKESRKNEGPNNANRDVPPEGAAYEQI